MFRYPFIIFAMLFSVSAFSSTKWSYTLEGCDANDCVVLDEGISDLDLPRATLSDFTYTIEGCDSNGCVILSEGNAQNIIDELGEISNVVPFAKGKRKTGKGKKSFLQTLVEWTGNLIDAVSDFFSSMADLAVEQGYEKMTITLEGPAGTVTGTFDLKSKDWVSIRKSSPGSPIDKPPGHEY